MDKERLKLRFGIHVTKWIFLFLLLIAGSEKYRAITTAYFNLILFYSLILIGIIENHMELYYFMILQINKVLIMSYSG